MSESFCGGCPVPVLITREQERVSTARVIHGRHDLLAVIAESRRDISQAAAAIGCKELAGVSVEPLADELTNKEALEYFYKCPAYAAYLERLRSQGEKSDSEHCQEDSFTVK